MFSSSPTNTSGQQSEVPQMWTEGSGAIKGPSPQEPLCQKEWVIGSYVDVWRPIQAPHGSDHDGQRWQNRPALLIDIYKQGSSSIRVQFVVLYLYNKQSAAQRVQILPRWARWSASASLWTWPREYMYVLSNESEIVYEWNLRIWSRSVPPFISTRWALDTQTSRLAKSDAWLANIVSRALGIDKSIHHFLELPREVRNNIYDYLLLNVHRSASQSRTYTHRSPARWSFNKKWWLRRQNYSVSVPGPPSKIYTPSILRVCNQIRCEVLEILYRTKVMTITIDFTEDNICNLSPKLLRSLSQFLHIRIDLVTACAEEMLEGFQNIASLLLEHAMSLRFLNIRIGYSHMTASAALHDHGFALLTSCEDVMRSMRLLLPCLRMPNKPLCEGLFAEYNQIRITWGVSEIQIQSDDFSCTCTYLSASFLQQVWREVCGEAEGCATVGAVQLSEQNCQDFGCTSHS